MMVMMLVMMISAFAVFILSIQTYTYTRTHSFGAGSLKTVRERSVYIPGSAPPDILFFSFSLQVVARLMLVYVLFFVFYPTPSICFQITVLTVLPIHICFEVSFLCGGFFFLGVIGVLDLSAKSDPNGYSASNSTLFVKRARSPPGLL